MLPPSPDQKIFEKMPKDFFILTNIFIYSVFNQNMRKIFTFGRWKTAANVGQGLLQPFRVELSSCAFGATKRKVILNSKPIV